MIQFNQITKMPHFFINTKNICNDLVIIDDKENYQHIARSLRAKIGENLLMTDENRIRYVGIIQEITKNSIKVKIEKKFPSENYLDFNLYLAQVPLRSDFQNLVIEKATELGVEGVYPVYSDNCALSKSVIEKKISKWQRIMREASKQCERASVPNCFDMTTFEILLKSKKFDRIIAFCERNYKLSMKDYFSENMIKKGENILVIVGPEGGFTKREFEMFEKSGIIMLSLGDMILKAETAVIVGLGNIIYEYSNN